MSNLISPGAHITFDHASLSTEKADRNEAEQALHAVQYLNRTEFSPTNQSRTGLSFAYDRDSQRAIITVVDRSTGSVLSQMPAPEVLRLAADVRRRQAKLASSNSSSD